MNNLNSKTSKINIPRKKEQIKRIWKEHFRRELNDEELEKEYNWSVQSSRVLIAHLKNVSTEMLENHINTSDTVFFSPKALMKEINESINLLRDKFIDDTKFAEEFTAIQFVLAIRKLNGDKLLIALSDSPDIILMKIPINKVGVKGADKASFEVLRCAPDYEGFREEKFNEDFLGYIRKHKFSTDYGKAWLVVPFFSKKYHGDILKNFRDLIFTAKDNRFENIYLTELIDDKYQHFKLYRIYPDFFSIEVNLEQDRELIF